MNAASVQLFGAALDASDFTRVTDKPEVVPGQKSCSRRSLRSPFQDSFRLADNPLGIGPYRLPEITPLGEGVPPRFARNRFKTGRVEPDRPGCICFAAPLLSVFDY